MTPPRVVVLGAGILGSSLALFLARAGAAVTLYDKSNEPMAATSRWNEGKIHLGYLCGADPRCAPRSTSCPVGWSSPRCSPNSSTPSCMPPRATTSTSSTGTPWWASPGCAPGSRPSASSSGSTRTPAATSSTSPTPTPSPSRRPSSRGSRATTSSPASGSPNALSTPAGSPTSWRAPSRRRTGSPSGRGRRSWPPPPSTAWAGRGRCGAPTPTPTPSRTTSSSTRCGTAGCPSTPPQGWPPNRRGPTGTACACSRARDRWWTSRAHSSRWGPFGDVKNYDGRDFCLSWYPAGLVAEGEDLELAEPEPLAGARLDRFLTDVREGLGAHIPGIGRVFDDAEELTVGGGFVFARGTGSIGDRASTLHRRDNFGVQRRGSYFSVDTGKYSTAPWLAERLAAEIMS